MMTIIYNADDNDDDSDDGGDGVAELNRSLYFFNSNVMVK